MLPFTWMHPILADGEEVEELGECHEAIEDLNGDCLHTRLANFCCCLHVLCKHLVNLLQHHLQSPTTYPIRACHLAQHASKQTIVSARDTSVCDLFLCTVCTVVRKEEGGTHGMCSICSSPLNPRLCIRPPPQIFQGEKYHARTAHCGW